MSSVDRSPSSALYVRTLLIILLSILIGHHHPQPPGANAKTLPTIRIAVILPSLTPKGNDWMFATERVSPAIKIAVEDINAERKGFNLTVEYRNGRCDIAESLNHAIEYYVNHEVDVFFGPCCDYPAAPIARQTRFWNIPMLTAGTMAGEFGFDKQTLYPMLTRVGPNINSMASFVVNLLREHDWRKAKILYDSDAQGEIVSSLCHLVATGLYQTLKNTNNDNAEIYIKHDNFKLTKPFTDDEFREEIGHNYAGKRPNGEYFIRIELFSSAHSFRKTTQS